MPQFWSATPVVPLAPASGQAPPGGLPMGAHGDAGGASPPVGLAGHVPSEDGSEIGEGLEMCPTSSLGSGRSRKSNEVRGALRHRRGPRGDGAEYKMAEEGLDMCHTSSLGSGVSRKSNEQRNAFRDRSRASTLSTEVMNLLVFCEGTDIYSARLPNVLRGEEDRPATVRA